MQRCPTSIGSWKPPYITSLQCGQPLYPARFLPQDDGDGRQPTRIMSCGSRRCRMFPTCQLIKSPTRQPVNPSITGCCHPSSQRCSQVSHLSRICPNSGKQWTTRIRSDIPRGRVCHTSHEHGLMVCLCPGYLCQISVPCAADQAKFANGAPQG